VQAAAAEVALLYEPSAVWLNAAAAPYGPVTLQEADCSVLLDHPRLRVLGAPLQQVFVMKMFANRPIDLPDLAALWPVCGFVSVEAAVSAFYAGYPLENTDPHLAVWLAGVTGQRT